MKSDFSALINSKPPHSRQMIEDGEFSFRVLLFVSTFMAIFVYS